MIDLKQNDEFNSREKAFVVLVLEDFESIPWVGSQPPKLSKEFPIENWFFPLIILTALFARNNLINYYINNFDIISSALHNHPYKMIYLLLKWHYKIKPNDIPKNSDVSVWWPSRAQLFATQHVSKKWPF